MTKPKDLKIQVLKVNPDKPGAGWYFRVIAHNGCILCHSESYTRRNAARGAAEILQAKLPKAEIELVDGQRRN